MDMEEHEQLSYFPGAFSTDGCTGAHMQEMRCLGHKSKRTDV